MNIKRQLNNGDYQKALAVLKAAVVTWPDSEIFSATRTEDTTATDQSKDTRYIYIHTAYMTVIPC